MTHYFDEATSEITIYASVFIGDSAGLLAAMELIEERVIQDVVTLTGDRQFPDDMRERMLSAIACQRIRTVVPGVPTEGRAYAKTTRASKLLGTLHSLFHELAGLKREVRWGVLSDDPGGMVKARDRFDRRPGSGDGYTP